ncbi:hypothetical protein [Saccharopolyspora sp. NPDC002686]|uniref:DUF7144 family membrane protein n=1 Tax=Saccharopolyspora sp. NPDC002686 TaxID=3154541 RepID=UPI0033205DB6
MTTHGAGRARTGWVGWAYFAAAVLLVVGIIQIVNGVIAFAHSGTVLTPTGTVVHVSYGTIGWSYLIMGAVLVATGAGLFSGRTWARVVAVVLAAISLLANIAFFAMYPLWSAVVIVLNAVVIYALVAHGKEISRR